jgi:hypothetical protein
MASNDGVIAKGWRVTFVADADAKILECPVVRPVVPLLRIPDARDQVWMGAFVPRPDVGKRGVDRHVLGETEFGFHHDRMTLSRVAAAVADHAIAIQVEVSAREEVLVGDRDVAFARRRQKGLRRRRSRGRQKTRNG